MAYTKSSKFAAKFCAKSPFLHTEYEAGYEHVNPHEDNVVHSWITEEQRAEKLEREKRQSEEEKRMQDAKDKRLAEEIGERLSISTKITVDPSKKTKKKRKGKNK